MKLIREIIKNYGLSNRTKRKKRSYLPRTNQYQIESLEPRILLSADPLGLTETVISLESPPEPLLVNNAEEPGGALQALAAVAMRFVPAGNEVEVKFKLVVPAKVVEEVKLAV